MQLVRTGQLRDQPGAGNGFEGLRRLALAGLDQHAAARRQPLRGCGSHPSHDVEPVAATVERHPRLVQASLRREQPDLSGWHVRHVGGQDVNAPPQGGGQRVVQVAFVDLAAGTDITPGAPDGGRVDVSGIQFDPVQGSVQRGTHRARAAAQVDDNRPRAAGRAGICGRRLAGQGDGLAHEKLGAVPRDEYARIHDYPQAAELRPAHHLLQGQARGPLVQHGGEFGRGARRGAEQLRLVLSKDTARGPEPGDDVGLRPGPRGGRHEFTFRRR